MPQALAKMVSNPWCRIASHHPVSASSRPCDRHCTVRPSRFCTTKRLWNTMRIGASRLESRISRNTLSDSLNTPPYALGVAPLEHDQHDAEHLRQKQDHGGDGHQVQRPVGTPHRPLGKQTAPVRKVLRLAQRVLDGFGRAQRQEREPQQAPTRRTARR